MKKLNTIFLFSVLLISGACSEHIPSKSEQFYLNAADSLRAYEATSYLQKELAGNEKARDLLKLDYETFKDKYDWTDEEVEVFTDIILGHVRIAKKLESFDLQSE